MHTFEIVGLNGVGNGRSCEIHECCGSCVMVGDVLRLKSVVVNINGSMQEAMKLVSLKNRSEKCTVAFVPKVMLRGQGVML